MNALYNNKKSGMEEHMMMNREAVIEAVRTAACDGRLSCSRAHELEKELGIPLSEIGRICNELKIKITACQLGCF